MNNWIGSGKRWQQFIRCDEGSPTGCHQCSTYFCRFQCASRLVCYFYVSVILKWIHLLGSIQKLSLFLNTHAWPEDRLPVRVVLVWVILKWFRETGTFFPKRKGKCRKRKNTHTDNYILVRKSKINLTLAAVNYRNFAASGIYVSDMTVHRGLLMDLPVEQRRNY